MKAALLFVAGLAIAISSNAPADAAPVHPTGNAPWVGCSWAGGWNFSSTCRNLANFKTYNECTAAAPKRGATPLESWWYCSSLGLKN